MHWPISQNFLVDGFVRKSQGCSIPLSVGKTFLLLHLSHCWLDHNGEAAMGNVKLLERLLSCLFVNNL